MGVADEYGAQRVQQRHGRAEAVTAAARESWANGVVEVRRVAQGHALDGSELSTQVVHLQDEGWPKAGGVGLL